MIGLSDTVREQEQLGETKGFRLTGIAQTSAESRSIGFKLLLGIDEIYAADGEAKTW
jgi:hypothetical protein